MLRLGSGSRIRTNHKIMDPMQQNCNKILTYINCNKLNNNEKNLEKLKDNQKNKTLVQKIKNIAINKKNAIILKGISHYPS